MPSHEPCSTHKKLAKILFSGVLSKAMKPARFVYHAPHTMDEAVAMLAQVAPDDGRVIAGGQSLVPAMALRLPLPAPLLDINPGTGVGRLAGRKRGLSGSGWVGPAA